MDTPKHKLQLSNRTIIINTSLRIFKESLISCVYLDFIFRFYRILSNLGKFSSRDEKNFQLIFRVHQFLEKYFLMLS